MEFLDVIDENDHVVGRAPKEDIYTRNLPHRIVHIFVFDGNRLFLSKRSDSVEFCPGHWVTSAAGHVQSGETYEEAAKRELEEEIGIRADITFRSKYEYNGSNMRKMLAVFEASHNGPFTVNPREVSKVKAFTLQEISRMEGEKFHPELLFLLRNHYNIVLQK